MMTREVYANKKFIEFSRSQVFIRVFADTQPEGASLARKFGIEGYPTLIILDSKGREIERIEGAMRTEDLMEALTFIFENARDTRITI